MTNQILTIAIDAISVIISPGSAVYLPLSQWENDEDELRELIWAYLETRDDPNYLKDEGIHITMRNELREEVSSLPLGVFVAIARGLGDTDIILPERWKD